MQIQILARLKFHFYLEKIGTSKQATGKKPVLRIRDVYPGSTFFHPGSGFFNPGSRIRIKELKYFNPEKLVSKLQEI